jgi:HK97 family phage major capsid protein
MATLTSGSFVIPQAEAAPLLTRSRKDSFVLRNATRVAVTGAGATVPVFTTDIEGDWVNEAASKPVADAVITNKNMAIRKWAVIVPVSEESVTDQNSMNLLAEVVANAQGGFGRAVDRLAITGSGIGGQTFINQTTKAIELGSTLPANGGLWKDLNEGLRLLVEDSGPDTPRSWTGSVFDAATEPDFNEAVDLNGRPLFTDTLVGESDSIDRYGRLLGRPSALLRQIQQGGTVGWAGDWSRVFYGLIGDIRVDYDNRATIKRGSDVISAFQDNLVLVRIEARVGVLVADPEDFVKFTDVVANS